uniref:Uncharacterized protein n=1 Tax=Rhizophora mucronata TaxID=61149 RepID=A0A2P2K9W9_RHIMU
MRITLSKEPYVSKPRDLGT